MVKLKESEKGDKYQNLASELKMAAITIIICAFGTVTKKDWARDWRIWK